MIGEGLIDLLFNIFGVLFGAFDAFNLPLSAVNVLTDLLGYGIWIIGVDMMALIIGSVVFWWGVHLSIGLAVWLWDRLPLT